MPVSGAHLGGALPSVGTLGRNALSLCTPKQWSLASPAGPDFFLDSLPASCGALTPSGCVHTSNPSLLPGIWPPTQDSAPSLHPLQRWADKPLRLVSAGWHRSSPLCPLHPCCCALLCGFKASPSAQPAHPLYPPVKGLPSVWKLFLLHSSLPEVQVPSLFFCVCFFFFLLPYTGTWGFSCLLGSLRSSASIQ